MLIMDDSGKHQNIVVGHFSVVLCFVALTGRGGPDSFSFAMMPGELFPEINELDKR